MIIIEGPDGGGKTFLSEQLKSYYGSTLKVYKQHDHDDMLGAIASSYKGHLCSAIADRFHISEIIYGKLIRNSTRHATSIRMIDRALRSERSVVIFCLPPFDVAVDAWRKRKADEYLQREIDLARVYEAYAKYTPSVDFFVYNRANSSSLGVLLTWLDERNRKFTDDKHLSGLYYPAKALLVADRPSCHSQLYPFTRLKFGCSEWLTTQLEEAGIQEEKLSWVNAYPKSTSLTNHRNIELIKHVAQSNPKMKIVALGKAALTALSASKIRVDESFVHPNYHKRFLHNQPYPLIRYLKEVL